MGQVTQLGQINTTALVVPDLYVQIVPPQTQYINGVPTNVLGIVGTATWGPANSPTLVGNISQYAAIFGPIQARKYDLGTPLAAAVLQGANNFKVVRVTDGTDTAATISLNGLTLGVQSAVPAAAGTGYAVGNVLAVTGGTSTTAATLTVTSVGLTGGVTGVSVSQAGNYTAAPTGAVAVTGGTGTAATFTLTTGAVNSIAFTSKFTGSFGNGITVTLSAGSQVSSQKVVVSAPNLVPEAFDNIGGGSTPLTGVALWQAIAAAINNGTTALRGPSQIIVASAGGVPTAPTAATSTLTGGTDGATGVTGTALIGQDTVPRTGMYALRNSGASVAMLSDCDTSTTWSTQIAFGLSEGTYMVMTGPSGDNITNAVSTKSTAGIDSYAGKLMFGDWVYWLDPYNNVLRVISPQGFVAGLLANLSPQNSTLNKQIQGIVGTQKTSANQTYSAADLQSLGIAGIDVITNPVPGGSYFGCRFGHNSSSNPMTNGDNYTRMTNYIAYTLNAGMGRFVGMLQSATVRQQAQATIAAFLGNLQQQNMIGDPNGGPCYSVQIDANNNPSSRIALGYMQADVSVKYLAVIEKFLINLQGGTSVQINKQTTQLA